MTIHQFQQHQPKVGQNVYIAPSAIVIGQVDLDDDVSVWPTSVIRGDVNHISIGKRTNIQDGSIIHVNHDHQYYPGGSQVIIGDDVTVGHRVIIHGGRIANCCLIGMGCLIMDDTVIESEVILGAGSLVPQKKLLKSGHLYLGNPAKLIRPLTAEEKTMLRYSATHYVKLKNHYLTP
jgi:carbonic anhydrase/acetyltransferase-like protein (isoleucine patch superfamily)